MQVQEHPAAFAGTTASSVPGYLFERLEGNRACLLFRRGGAFTTWTYLDLWTRVADLAYALDRRGIRAGDRVALFSNNRPEWIVCDLAVLSLGAVCVPRGANCAPAELAFILSHSRCKAALLETPALLDCLGDAKRRLEFMAIIEGTVPDSLISLDTLLRGGAGRPKTWFSQTLAARRPDELATVVYTSGTTANPKGVILSSANILHNLMALPQVIPLSSQDRFLALLPPWHMFERTVEYVALSVGASLTYTDLPHLADDLRAGTTVLASVPRIWIGVYERILAAVKEKPLFSRAVFWWMVWWSTRWLRAPPLLKVILGPAHRVHDAALFSKIRRQVGADLRLSISGGGSLPRRVDEFFAALGLVLLNGYGLTETSPVVAVRRLGRTRLGSVGPPLPQTEVRIVGESGQDMPAGRAGEVWVRGPQVFAGYWDNPDATKDALKDGWFATGDLGLLDGQGWLYLTGRKKELIVLCNGEKVEPTHLEQELCQSPLILQALVVGTDQKRLGALIVPDAGHFEAHRHSFPGLGLEAAVRKEIGRLINNAAHPKWEHIRAFRLLSNQFVMGEEITHTLKLKRAVIEARCKDLIEGMFKENSGK